MHNYIDAQELAAPIDALNRFKNIALPKTEGFAEFRIGKVSRDVSFTHSHCQFNEEYHACIEYSEPTTLLIFGLQGCSSFKISDSCQTNIIHSGDIWYIHLNQGQLQRTTPAGQENQMVVIKYTGQRLLDALNGDEPITQQLAMSIARLGHQASANFGISELVSNPLDTASNRLLAESYALQLLARWVAPNHQATQTLSKPNNSCLSATEQAGLERVIKILASDLIRPPPLQELANHANMSHTKLNRCFKKAYGATVYHWLRNYRLEQARHYLHSGECSITDIAFQCGFSSASHFAQSFKKQYVCSPAIYREQIHQHPQ